MPEYRYLQRSKLMDGLTRPRRAYSICACKKNSFRNSRWRQRALINTGNCIESNPAHNAVGRRSVLQTGLSQISSKASQAKLFNHSREHFFSASMITAQARSHSDISRTGQFPFAHECDKHSIPATASLQSMRLTDFELNICNRKFCKNNLTQSSPASRSSR